METVVVLLLLISIIVGIKWLWSTYYRVLEGAEKFRQFDDVILTFYLRTYNGQNEHVREKIPTAKFRDDVLVESGPDSRKLSASSNVTTSK